MPDPLLPETILQNHYRILHTLGGGGMGRVYLAQDLRLAGVHVAVKELVDTYLPQAERAQAVQLFYQEAVQLARLRHPAIPHVSDHFAEGGRLYLVLEYIAGETLESIVQRTPGFLPEAQVRDWALQLCEVLEYLHGQQPPVIFRDLKPANVMVMPDGRVRLIDFGIARLFDPRKMTDTLKMGTLGYAPPEQYVGRGQTDAVSDIYALGATLHHLATKRDPRQEPPFSFPPPRALNPALSPGFERVIQRALRYERAERFQSAAEMRQAIAAGDTTGRRLVVGILAVLVTAACLFLAASGVFLVPMLLPTASSSTTTPLPTRRNSTPPPTVMQTSATAVPLGPTATQLLFTPAPTPPLIPTRTFMPWPPTETPTETPTLILPTDTPQPTSGGGGGPKKSPTPR